MKTLIFLSIFLIVSAVEEPEAINDQELHDEVSTAQTRAK